MASGIKHNKIASFRFNIKIQVFFLKLIQINHPFPKNTNIGMKKSAKKNILFILFELFIITMHKKSNQKKVSLFQKKKKIFVNKLFKI